MRSCTRPSATDEYAKWRPDRALRLAGERGLRGNEAWALRLIGDVAAQFTTEASEAHDYYHAALSIAEELNMRPLIAHCHLGFGKLYRRSGDDVKAQEHMTTATTMYREMGMTFWLEKAEAELAGAES